MVCCHLVCFRWLSAPTCVSLTPPHLPCEDLSPCASLFVCLFVVLVVLSCVQCVPCVRLHCFWILDLLAPFRICLPGGFFWTDFMVLTPVFLGVCLLGSKLHWTDPAQPAVAAFWVQAWIPSFPGTFLTPNILLFNNIYSSLNLKIHTYTLYPAATWEYLERW